MSAAGHVDVSVVTSGHDVADARLHREVAALLRHGMRVEVLGLGDAADGPPGAQVRTWPRPGPVGRAALAAQLAMRARGRVLITLDPDSAVAAGTAVLASGRVLVIDVHEDYAQLLADRAWASAYGGLAGTAARRIVTTFTGLAQRAALTVVADDHVPPLRARNRLVVRNEPDPAMLPEPAAPDATPRALYVGDLRTSRGLFAMIGALRHATQWHLDLVGPVAPADQDRLDAELTGDLRERVHLHGRRPPTQAWELASGAWCGLALLADTPAFRDALPSKVWEYLACGLPVVTTDLARTAALVRRESAGVVVPSWAPGVTAPSGASGSDAPRSQVGSGADLVDEATVARAVGEHLAAWSADPVSLDGLRRAAREAGDRRRRERTAYDDFADAVARLL